MSTNLYDDDHDKVQLPFSQVRRPADRRKDIDVKEALDRELSLQSGIKFTQQLLPTGNIQQITNTPVKYGLTDRFFYLDSNAKNSDSELGQGKLVYSFSTLNQSQSVDYVIEMEIGTFFLPEIPTTANFPTYYFFRRLNLLIEEMNAAAIFAQSNRRFHFELGITPAGISNLTTDVGFSKFIFTRPFRNLVRGTFRFMAPTYKNDFKNVRFEQDILNINAVPLVVGGVFGGATITTTVPHGLTVGSDVSVYINNFVSNVGNIDTLINSVDGFLLRVINANTLEFRAPAVVGFDFTTVLVPVPGTMLVGYRRIAFTMRFRSLLEGETNTIVPV